MGRIFTFLFGVLTGAVGLAIAMQYAVVRANDGFHFVPKVQPCLRDAYVDVRSFSADDWRQHPQLAASLVRADRTHLLSDPALTTMRDTLDRLLGGPAIETTP
jgi:hypothetical protein